MADQLLLEIQNANQLKDMLSCGNFEVCERADGKIQSLTIRAGYPEKIIQIIPCDGVLKVFVNQPDEPKIAPKLEIDEIAAAPPPPAPATPYEDFAF